MARRLTPEARRAEIIETVDELIAAEGYRSLSLREVARRCGMSAPGLMHYFPDMTSLLDAVLERRDEIDLDAITLEQPADARIEDIIESSLLYYERAREKTRRYDALEAEAIDPTHPAHAFYLERDDRSFERMRPYIEREFEDPDRASKLLRAVFDGLRFRVVRDPEHVDLRKEWHAVRDVVLGCLERRISETV
ncbi:TetR/AcrR family transcriptional regulator [Microbacterium sp. B2969]|uniref:TetR/AcrR family transcriptional regulator n=1 Tax=Microbacterium alkaliflavum TaxID=3248839 RepID=A0ABW7Q410_9MICO